MTTALNKAVYDVLCVQYAAFASEKTMFRIGTAQLFPLQ